MLFRIASFSFHFNRNVYGTRFDVCMYNARGLGARRVCLYLAHNILFCWRTIIIIVIVTKLLLLLLLLLFVANGHKHTLNCFKLQTIHSKSQMNWCEKESVKKKILACWTHSLYAMFLSYFVDIWHVAHLQCQRYLVDAHDTLKCS